MVPSERPGAVAPVCPGKIIFKDIPSEISGKKDMVLVIDPVIDLGIQVIEIELVVLQVLVVRKGQEEVGIGPPGRYYE